jgi:hypothetical protein
LNHKPWQSTFGKLLVASSIAAAIAGYAIVNMMKDNVAAPVEEAATNEAFKIAPAGTSGFEEQEPSVPVADQTISDSPPEPDVEQSSYDEQSVDQSVTETATDDGGVQE